MGKTMLISLLREEMEMGLKGGIYHVTQIKLCYNSNRIEGSRLSEEQTRYIYETNTVDAEDNAPLRVDDVIETVNHFACFRYLLSTAGEELSEKIIKKYHKILKTGTSDAQKTWFCVGNYKKRPNIVGDRETSAPEHVAAEMRFLLEKYHENGSKTPQTLDTLIAFHHAFERIHPFQDGNGRVGRLILFRECLKNNIVPFIIDDEHKLFYYRGLNEYPATPDYLRDTCLSAQDTYKKYLDYFKIEY